MLLRALLKSGWKRFVTVNDISSKSQLKNKKTQKHKNNNNNNTPINIVFTVEKEKIHKVKIAVIFIN